MPFGAAQNLKVMAVGRLKLIPQLGLLLRGEEKIDIPQKPFEILVALAEAGGEPLSKEAILDRVWPDQIVEENCLQGHMTVLRKALGADRAIIQTKFGYGYGLSEPPVLLAGKGRADPFPPLPIINSTLIGRDGEFKDLCALLKTNSLLTVTGTGGVGKSRLALEAASRSKRLFPSGICLIELARISDPSLVSQTIGSRFHLDLDFTDEIPSETRNQKTLLVLDNCEYVLEAVCAVVQKITAIFPKIRILCTSQEPLGIGGEQVYRLKPLGLPPESLGTLGEVLSYPAAKLLAVRIKDADKAIELTDTDATNVCRICRQLDGIPLALELAAARVPLLGLSTVTSDLTDRFRLLSGGRRSDLPRHRTLRATLEWSVGLLDEEERRFLQQLGSFAGPFTLQAATFVASDKIRSGRSPHQFMAELVSKSLVSVERPGAEPRFKLLESMRLLMLERLIKEKRLAAIAERHAEFFQARLTTAANDWQVMPHDKWLEQYGEDLADVRAALDWTFTEGRDLEHAAALLCSSLPFWMQLSLLDECGKRVTSALDRLAEERLNHQQEMKLSAALGASTTWVYGPTPETKKAWSRALSIAQTIHNDEYCLQGHYGLWLYYLRAGDYAAALASAQAMLALASALEDRQAIYAGQRTVGVALHFMGEHERGGNFIDVLLHEKENLDRAFPFRFAVDQRTAALAYRSRILWVQGREKEALKMAHDGVCEARELEHLSSLCCALLEGACTVTALARRSDLLEPYAQEAFRLAERYNLGFWKHYAKAFLALSTTFSNGSPHFTGELERAVDTLQQIHLHPGYPYFNLALAELESQRGSLRRTEALFDCISNKPHWAMPELIRLHSKPMSSPMRLANLHKAESQAKQAGALAWLARIHKDLDAARFN